ncbi:DeoR/GlpR family DNA-binding transcription regulator [Enterococcus sp. ALS3]|uniref:DeoR/GlpR family DNA-binding transcription regulator n=1 Tax=Enterococcus alishanensis TaxID=1303817 RepID=A0ABS6THD7_9ENTE|nr:DeoR/GlpR family DNA-binding transcription regulator [Enterococcus alishanensis]MBV7392358.1 DeoR/GlpR family DNA-binding transcription regulator [Enterococcus alishanensis]
MLATERESLIREKIITNGIVYVADLVKEMNVTSPTIRNDLDKLVKKYDDLDRIHGGVIYKSKEENSLSEVITGYSERSFENISLKKTIAKRALLLIENGDTLLIDSSSTCFELASLLAESNKKVTIITNGLSTGTVLKQNPKLTVLVIGGLLHPSSNTIYDEFNSPIYTMFNIDKYFFSASGLSIKSGFSEFNIMEVKNKKANVDKSRISIALVDSTKFDKDSTSTFCTLAEVDYLVTDDQLENNLANEYRKEINLLIG